MPGGTVTAVFAVPSSHENVAVCPWVASVKFTVKLAGVAPEIKAMGAVDPVTSVITGALLDTVKLVFFPRFQADKGGDLFAHLGKARDVAHAMHHG